MASATVAAKKKTEATALKKAEAERKKEATAAAKKKKTEAAALKKAETERKKEEAKRKKEEAIRKREEARIKKQEETARKKAEKKAEAERKKKEKEKEAARKKAESAATVKPKRWQDSKARKMLKADIEDGTVTVDAYDALNNPDGTKAEDAYLMRNEYQQYKFEKFQEFLEAMRVSIRNNKHRAARDAMAVTQFRQLHPKPAKNHRGEPRWEGSAAEAQLKKDIDNGVHLVKRPSEMRAETIVYQQYYLRTIISHIDQEVRARKFVVYLKDKNDKKKKELGK